MESNVYMYKCIQRRFETDTFCIMYLEEEKLIFEIKNYSCVFVTLEVLWIMLCMEKCAHVVFVTPESVFYTVISLLCL